MSETSKNSVFVQDNNIYHDHNMLDKMSDMRIQEGSQNKTFRITSRQVVFSLFLCRQLAALMCLIHKYKNPYHIKQLTEKLTAKIQPL